MRSEDVAAERDAELQRIGARVRELREAAGITQQQVADHLHVHRMTVWRVEHGRFDLGASQIRSLAALLGVRPSSLIDFE
jgi:transcriptional regulator with XRE-family HTH domain